MSFSTLSLKLLHWVNINVMCRSLVQYYYSIIIFGCFFLKRLYSGSAQVYMYYEYASIMSMFDMLPMGYSTSVV